MAVPTFSISDAIYLPIENRFEDLQSVFYQEKAAWHDFELFLPILPMDTLRGNRSGGRWYTPSPPTLFPSGMI